MRKKHLSKNTFSGVFLLVLLFILTFSVSHATTVTMISRLDFAPGMLEMVKLDLERSLQTKVSLNFQPVLKTQQISLRKSQDLLLVENGFPEEMLPQNYELIPDSEVSLVWVLGLSDKAKELMNEEKIINLKDFGKLLIKLKKQNPSTFPWFESLFSKNTLFNLNLVLGEDEKIALNPSVKQDFWLYKDAVKVLYEAMGDELLNPLSLESDELLAFNVFMSGDCAATSLWVPSEFLIKQEVASKFLGNVLLLPFPSVEGKAVVPKVSFHIYKYSESKFKGVVASICIEKNEFYSFVDCKFQKALSWINSKYAERYDQLLVGDY